MVDAIPAQISLKKNSSNLFDKTPPLEQTFPLGENLAIFAMDLRSAERSMGKDTYQSHL